MSIQSRWKIYRELAKSGIVTLVLISVLSGYVIGHSHESTFDLARMIWTLLGILFLASGSSALNQYQERFLDAKMPRTASRPLPSGRIPPREALVFIGATLAFGLALLAVLSQALLVLGVLAVISYNGLYTLWWKRKWAFAAIPGAVPGALPILMGYAAAAGRVFDPAGVYLFAILFYWQMPHFWVLAHRYREDYAKGGVPTLPVARGSERTVREIAVWCVGYVALALMAPFFLEVRWIYFAPAALMSFWVLRELLAFAREPNGKHWLHFFLWINASLIVYLAAAAIDRWSYIALTPYWTRG